MERLKITQVAQELGITPAGVYKKLKTEHQLVEHHVIKEKRGTFVTREGLDLLKATMQKPMPVNESTSIQPVDLQEIIANQQRTIDTLLFQQEEGRKRTDTILMKLTNDISSLQKALEYKATVEVSPLPDSPPPIRPWKPEPKKQASFTWLEEIWFSLWKPERLRAEP